MLVSPTQINTTDLKISKGEIFRDIILAVLGGNNDYY